MHPVPVTYFALKLSEADTYHDVLRIFYGEILTNNVIDNMLRAQPYKKQRQESVAMGRPRIGGVSDTMTMSRRTPRLDGIVMSPFMLDSPDDSAEPAAEVSACPDCDKNTRTLFTDTSHHSRHQRHRDRRRKEKGKTHPGAGSSHPSSPLQHTEDLNKALNHTKEMEQLTRCHQPVPVVVRIRDISTAANKEYFPKCTIVHHCRADAGCCNESATCAPKTNVTISRQFFAVEYKKSENTVELAPDLVETFTFVNHTECECKKVKELPRCLDCPFPFHLRRENHTECACDCFDRDRTCIRIKKGKSALQEDQLRCIKEQHCHRPKCQYGTFDESSIKTGYCPKGGRSKSSSREGGRHTTQRPSHRRRGRGR